MTNLNLEFLIDFQCYFNVRNSPPTALIKGGRSRTQHYHSGHTEPVILDATESRDESDLSKSDSLKFHWHWRLETDIPSVKHSCSLLSSSCKDSASVIEVIIPSNVKHVFSVDVMSDRSDVGEGKLSSTTTQTVIQVLDGLRVSAA